MTHEEMIERAEEIQRELGELTQQARELYREVPKFTTAGKSMRDSTELMDRATRALTGITGVMVKDRSSERQGG